MTTSLRSVPIPAVLPSAAVFRDRVLALRRAVHEVIVGQDETVLGVLTAVLAGGHVLLQGPPGVGKTLLVKTLSRLTGLVFSRIQFTPDLLPSDILGGATLGRDADGLEQLEFRPGPIFASLVLADEVNRASPRTQAAFLEAMEERQVTAHNATHALPRPFLVLATENPFDDGTYPVPASQLDRFMMCLQVDHPSEADLVTILERDPGARLLELEPVLDRADLLELMSMSEEVVVAPELHQRIAALVGATEPHSPHATPLVREVVRQGISPRGAQALLRAARVRAAMAGRHHLATDDLRAVALPVLRHRLVLDLAAEVGGISRDAIVRELLTAIVR